MNAVEEDEAEQRRAPIFFLSQKESALQRVVRSPSGRRKRLETFGNIWKHLDTFGGCLGKLWEASLEKAREKSGEELNSPVAKGLV